jgi:transposase
MLENLLLPPGAPLQLCSADIAQDRVTLDVQTTAASAVCPTCHLNAGRVHSRYQRTLADLPLTHTPVSLQLRVRRFFCDNLACPRRTFSEPVPGLAMPFARRTTRLSKEQRQLGLDLGGEAGARLARRQGMAVSATTLLRLARQASVQPQATPRCLGIDDFALRKGKVYRTILVDLETHQPIELLPERSAKVVEHWLKAHPSVEVITRDRSNEYAEGASRGAPDAIQVADRFHLLQNVREMLQRLLERHQDALRAAATESRLMPDEQDSMPSAVALPPEASPATAAVPAEPSEQTTLAPPLTRAAQHSQERRARRLARYRAVRELRAQGLSMRAIAVQLQLSRKTVRLYSVADQFPERATRRPAPSKLDSFIPYLEQQLATGHDNAVQLWRELCEKHGFTGSRALVSRWVAQHRQLVPPPETVCPSPRRRGRPPAPATIPSAPPQRHLSARKAAWLLVCRREELAADEQSMVERLCSHSPSVDTAYQLAQDFIHMVREREAAEFDGWLSQARASGIAELQSFVVGLERDKAAVVAALTLPYSNGQVEGQVNRLKLIKRQMVRRVTHCDIAPRGSQE